MSTVSEVDVLRSQVAELSRELAARDQALHTHSRHRDSEFEGLRKQSTQLQAIVTGTADETGEDFFPALVTHLTSVLGMQYAVVGEVRQDAATKKIRTRAVAAGGALVDNFEYDLLHTPCETALASSFAWFEREVRTSFPLFTRLDQLNVEGYCGLSLRSKSGAVIGLLVIMDVKPICDRDWLRSVLTIFASRAAAELERAQAEQERNQALADLHNVVETIPDIVFALDTQGNLMKWNRRLVDVTGYRPEELSGISALTFVPMEEQASTAAAIQRAFTEGYATLEGHLLTKAHGRIPYHWTGAVLKNPHGEPIGITGIGRDVSDKKQAEVALRASEERFALAVEGSTDILWDAHRLPGEPWYAPQTLIWWSPRIRELLDLEQSELFETLEQWARRLHPDDKDCVFGKLAAHIEHRVPYDAEYRLRTNRGDYLWIRARGQARWDEQGEIHRMSGSCQDITERKQAEEALRLSEERFRAVFDNAAVGIAVGSHTTGTGIDQVNPAFASMLGYTPEELCRLGMKGLTFPDDIPASKEFVSELLEGTRSYGTLEKRYVKKDGSLVWAQTTVSSIFDKNGRYLSSIALIQDITERKRAERIIQHRLEFERLIASLSTHFISLPSSRIDAGINQALYSIGEFTKSDRSYVFLFRNDGRIVDNMYEWCADGIVPQIDNLQGLPTDSFPWIMARHRRGEVTHLLRIADLPPEANAEKEEFEREGIQSLLTLPIVSSSGVIGFVGFDSVRIERPWDDDDIALLKIVGEMLANVIERKQMEATLQERKEQFQSLVDNIPGAVYRCAADEQWTMAYLSDAIEGLTGYPAGEFLNNQVRSYASVIHPDDRRLVEDVVQAGLDKKEPYQLEYRLLHCDGTTRWVYESGQGVFSSDGALCYCDGAIFDITERKALEQQRREQAERLSLAMDIADLATWDWDIATNKVIWSDNCEQVKRLSPGTFDRTFEGYQRLLHPDDLQMLHADINRALTGADPYRTEHRIIPPGGEVQWIEGNGVVYRNEDGQPVRMVGTVRNITARRVVEEALRVSEERFTTAFNEAAIGMALVAPDGRWLEVNQALCQILGYSTEELQSHTFHTHTHPDDLQQNLLLLERLLSGELQTYQMEKRYLHKEGHTVWAILNVSSVRSHEGQVRYQIAQIQDITERKRAEQLLEAEKQVLALMATTQPLTDTLTLLCECCESIGQGMLVSVLLLDQDGRRLRHGAAPRLPDAYISAIDGIAIGPDVGSCGTAAYFRRQVLVADIATDPLWEKYRGLALSHGLRSCWSTPVLSEDGGVLGTFAIYYRTPHEPLPCDWHLIDRMTRLVCLAIERKQAEQALRTSEEKLRQALLASNTGLWDWNTETGEVSFSKEWKSQLGFSEKELPDTFESWEARLHPDDRACAVAYARQYLDNPAGAFRQDFRLLHKNGTYRWIDSHASFVTESDGRRVRLLGSHTDITARKQMEEALRESEMRYRSVVTALAEGIVIQDVKGTILSCNTSACLILGLAEDQMLGRTSFDPQWRAIHEDGSPFLGAAHPAMETLRTGIPCADVVMGVHRPDGSMVWISINTEVVRGSDGSSIQGVVASFRDITARKCTEAELRMSQDRYARATAVGKVGVWELNVLQEQFNADDNLKALFGYKKDELSTDPFVWLNLVHPDDRAVTLETWDQVSRGLIETYSYEVRMIRKDGSIVWTHVRGHAHRNEAGNVVRLIGATMDITDRKRADERLLLTQFSIDRASDAVLWMDSEARVLNVNEAACRMLNYMREALTGLSLYDLDPNVSAESWTHHWEQLKQKGAMTFESRYWSSTGSVLEVEITANYLQYGGKEYNCVIVRDIGERKRAEAELRASEERYRSLVDNAPIGIFVNEGGRFVYANQELQRMLNARRLEELLGMPVLDRIAPEFHQVVKDRIHELMANGQPAPSLDEQYVRLDGSRVDVAVTAIPTSLNGTKAMQVLVLDITERKKAEEALRDSEQAIRALHEATAAPGLSFDERVQAVLEVGCRRFKLPIGMLTRSVGGKLEFTHVYAPGADIAAGMAVPLGNTYCSTTLQATSPVCFECAGGSDWQTHPGYKALGLESYIGTKLIGRGQVYGTICFASQDPFPALFNQADKDFVQLMARWISGEMDRRIAEQALKQSEERYRALYDETPAMYFTLASDGTVLSVNRFGAEQLGYQVEELIGHSVLRIFYEEDKEIVAARLSECLATPEITRHWEFRKVRKDGTVIWVRETAHAGRSSSGEPIVLVTCEDVTERKRAEEALRRSYDFMRQVIDTDPNFIFAKDREGRFTLVNKATADVYGTTVEGLIGKTDADFNSRHEEVTQFRQKDLEVMDSLQEQFIPEEIITDANKNVRWLQTVKRPLLDDQGYAVMLLGSSTDITARKRVEEMLRQRERDLRAAVEERERISEDLHDGILQSIFAVGLGLESCRALVSKLPLPRKKAGAPLMEALNRAIGQLNHVMTDVRHFIAGIESRVLEEADIGETLRTIVQAMCASNGTACRIAIEEAAVRELSTEQAYHVVNILREALSNSLRHSGAVRITLSFKRLRRSVRLSVTDNGIGFIQDSVRDVGHGLANMAARARKLGGRIEVRSRLRKGTKVLLDIPKVSAHA